jgi:hypothetical protein
MSILSDCRPDAQPADDVDNCNDRTVPTLGDACRVLAISKLMMQTIEVLVDGQQTEDFDEEDILEEFIERVQSRAAEPDSPQMFVVPLPELFGLSVDDSENCVVIVVDDLLPRDIPIQCEYFFVDVQVKRNGKSATSLVLAGGRVIISGDIVPRIWHEDDGVSSFSGCSETRTRGCASPSTTTTSTRRFLWLSRFGSAPTKRMTKRRRKKLR